MKNTIIYLIGFPGTGKYTIAKEICEQADVKLVDNHLINNPLFGLIKQDGITPLPERIWVNVKKVWEAVLDTIVHISPKDYNFVLTNFLVDEDQEGVDWFDEVQAGAEQKEATFVPVRLHISIEENKKRIVTPDRKERMKDINPKSPQHNADNLTVLTINHSNVFDLDVTDLSPQDAAKIILEHTASCS